MAERQRAMPSRIRVIEPVENRSGAKRQAAPKAVRQTNAKAAAKRQTKPAAPGILSNMGAAARGAALRLRDPELYKQILEKQRVLKPAPPPRRGGFATLGGSNGGGAAGGRVAVKK
jgi:hypothetical protein